MGKRKAKAKPAAKKKYTLPKTFDCPFCDHNGAVDIKLNHLKGHARLACGACGVNFQMTVSSLDDPIDVYHEWIDQCALVQTADGDARRSHGSLSATHSDDGLGGSVGRRGGDLGDGDDDDDGFVVRDALAEEDDTADYEN